MKQLRLPIFTSKIKIYHLRIVPPEPVFDEIVHLKNQFETAFGKQLLSKSKPHITIATFKMNSKYQDTLITAFDQLSRFENFNLTIDGFDVFDKNSNTLYLKITKTKSIEPIHKAVKILCSDNLGSRLKSLTIHKVPHITISKTKGSTTLYKSLAHFQKIGYFKQIVVDHFTLVSRFKHKTWDWAHQIKLS